MIVSALFTSFLVWFGTSQPTNFYPDLVSAKNAAKTNHKELLVFFTSSSCTNCEAAWSSFSKDVSGTSRFISTRMDIQDFDGAICFDMLGMHDVPGWVIMTSKAEIKEKWHGGWKDASGNPTLFDASTPQNTVREEKRPAVDKHNTANPVSTSTPTSTLKYEAPAVPATSAGTPVNTKSVESNQTGGFYIQAGYFGSEANAQKLVGDLKTKGYHQFKIESLQKDGSTFYKVISSTFSTEASANAEQQKMTSAGIKTSIKKKE